MAAAMGQDAGCSAGSSDWLLPDNSPWGFFGISYPFLGQLLHHSVFPAPFLVAAHAVRGKKQKYGAAYRDITDPLWLPW